MLIGILEDDPAQQELLQSWLTQAGHDTVCSQNASDFFDSLHTHNLDLAILDWQLPGKSGLEVLRMLRTRLESNMPVLFSTQRNAEEDIVTALETGADDYLTKPVRRAELLARVSALGRRAGVTDAKAVIRFGPLSLDSNTETITLHQEPIKLTRKDYRVALCLFENFGKVLSRGFLLKEVWGIDSGLDTRTVDVHVSRVRRALKISPDMGYAIKTIYHHGYRFEKVAVD